METVDTWRKSTYSGGNGGECVEVGLAGMIVVRDTQDRAGGTLAFTIDAWVTFLGKLH
jgi:hypothetical protein